MLIILQYCSWNLHLTKAILMNDFKTTFEKNFRYLIENHYPDLSADDLLSLTVVNVSEDQERIEVITPKSINSVVFR